jgi:hypothetical protein
MAHAADGKAHDAGFRNVQSSFRLFAQLTEARTQEADAAIEERYAKLGLPW